MGWAAAIAAPVGAGPFSLVSESEKLTAVSSRDYNGYVRTRLADGSFQPEAFAFGEGGQIDPPVLIVSDPTIDNLGFDAVARTIAVPLARQNYVRARDPNTTRLLIMVFWGRTAGSVNTRDGDSVDWLDSWNASLLGFNSGGFSELSFQPSIPGYSRDFRSSLLELSHHDVMDDLTVNRYFVILRAYDFQSLWRQKTLKLLWETRFSLSERRHDFKEDLPAMAQCAGLYFGRDTHGLVRIPPIPEGHIEIGDLKTLGEAPDR
jgi:hypothetical protein